MSNEVIEIKKISESEETITLTKKELEHFLYENKFKTSKVFLKDWSDISERIVKFLDYDLIK